MAAVASDRVFLEAELRGAHLKRLDEAQTAMEGALNVEPLLLFSVPKLLPNSNASSSSSGLGKACNELQQWIAPKASHLRKVIQDTTYSDDTGRHLTEFLGVYEQSIILIQEAVGGKHFVGWGAKKKVENCKRSLEAAWSRLDSHLSTIVIYPGPPGARQTGNSVHEAYLNSRGVLSGKAKSPQDQSSGERGAADPLDEATESSTRERPNWRKALDPSRKVLKAAAAAAEPIPGAGPIIKCIVGVLNATIDVLNEIDQNSQAIQDLCSRVTRLSTMVAMFQDENRSYDTSSFPQLQQVQRICERAQKDVERLKAQPLVEKVVFSTETANTLKDLNGNLGQALEELDVYLALNADQKLNTLNESDLVSLLGDADKGELRHQVNGGLCLPGTRKEVLDVLESWAGDVSSGSARLLLLHGQAGRGKSTIARTFAETFQKPGTAAASTAIFHFDRSREDFNARVVRVLVHQLARSRDARLRNAVLLAVQENKGIAESYDPKEQIRTLIIAPLESLKDNPPHILLILDALDECKFGASLLDHIFEYSSSLPPTTKFLVTSRPENHVLRAFNGLEVLTRTEDLDAVDSGLVHRDIHAYISTKLAQIGRASRLGDGWPGAPAVDRLVDLSEKLFQWAYTAIKYIEDEPETRLEKLVSPDEDEELDGPATTVVHLASLYGRIVKDAFPKESNVKDPRIPKLLQHVLGSLVVAPHPISPNELAYLWVSSASPTTKVLSRASREIESEILNRLRSILIVPAYPDEPVQFMHTSVRDFLTDMDPDQDPRFHVDVEQQHRGLAEVCLKRLKRDLKHFKVENICDANQTSAEVQDSFRKNVSLGLVYCARSWSAHLSQVPHDEATAAYLGLLDEFCRTNLVHWMEILSLAEAAHEIVRMTQQGKDWVCHHEDYSESYKLLDDAGRLCRQSLHIIATRPYHISRSVLLHCPLKTALRHYYSLGSGTPRVRRGPVYDNWPNNLWTKFVGAWVLGVAFSPDGKTIVSACADKTVRLWSVESGEQIGATLTGHTARVTSVAFSHDGKTVASASDDRTIRLWNIKRGVQIVAPLTGHIGGVGSVTFSPDGKTIASASRDQTIRFWSIESGEQSAAPLIGHTSGVASVAFSPDGQTIASASTDETIRLWSVESRMQIGAPLTGHTEAVVSVVFSPDGKTIASASDDKTVRLWSVERGLQIGAPFIGHTDLVSSVAFSPDGNTIASASCDQTVRFWSVESGLQIGAPLTGHTELVISVAFSPSGNTIASASCDKTVRLWSVENGPIGIPLIGHTDVVTSVAFSRDGKTIASASNDETVRLWSIGNGMQVEQVVSSCVDDLPSFERDPGASMASDNQQITLHGSTSGGDMVGWVFRNGVRWLWLPREWYVEPSEEILKDDSETLHLSLSNNILVIHHRNIHILVSEMS